VPIIVKTLNKLYTIGSRRKTERIFETMKAQGVKPALIERIDAPIGLEIGAEPPEEIAVSIASSARSLPRCMVKLEMPKQHAHCT
jgi:xanthine dehydrogenase accessory factor